MDIHIARLVQVRRKSIANLLAYAILKFDGWPWKQIDYLFYTTSSFVHYL